MDLYSRYPYWLMKDGILDSYSSLDADIVVDIAIMGAGISGALIAYYLRHSGFRVAVFDRRHVGMGSTAASTAFLQYEIDTPMIKLAQLVGEKNAVRSYEVCRKAIYDIENICTNLKPKFDFHLRPSLQYASYKKDKAQLHAEYKMRRKHGFDVKWLEPDDIKTSFGLDAPGAIFSRDAGEVDAYALTHALLKEFCKSGHNVYNNTHITDITRGGGIIRLKTESGAQIEAKKLVVACGYESRQYLPKPVGDIYSTYALVTEPVNEDLLWHKNSLVWETAVPYLYFRIVSGNRILIGGKDDKCYNPDMRDSRIKRKADMLIHSFNKIMRDIPVKADFRWAGAFAVTDDGLPYIGQLPQLKDTWFALGFGGNGITFSVVAAEIIRDSLVGTKNPTGHLFSFNR